MARKRTIKEEKIWLSHTKFRSEPQIPSLQNFILAQLKRIKFKSNKGYRYNIKIKENIGPVINGTVVDLKFKRKWQFSYIKAIKDVIVW